MIIIGQSVAVLPELLLVAAIWRHAHKVKMSNLTQEDMPYTMIFLRDGRLGIMKHIPHPNTDVVPCQVLRTSCEPATLTHPT